MRYDTMCAIYMRAKADVSQVNRPHGAKNKNRKIRKRELSTKTYAQKKRSGQEFEESVLKNMQV